MKTQKSKKSKKSPILTVKVTKRDIARGQPTDPEYCPIALALGRQPGIEYAEVNNSTIELALSEDSYDICLLKSPSCIRKFVKAFDKKGLKAVKPFSFRLRLPQVVETPGKILC